MKIHLQKLSFFAFIIIANLFVSNAMFGQTIGDYQSFQTGNWTTLSNWKYFNGSYWVDAANYPGQIAGTGAVLIQAGHTILVSPPATGTTAISTQTMGTLTIDGSLKLVGDNNNEINFIFNTPSLIVTPFLGTITMSLKVNLKLPENASIQVTNSLNPVYSGLIVESNCTHNQQIFIGTKAYAYCQGSGQEVTFTQLMDAGGYNFVTVTPLSASACGSGSFSFTATATPLTGSTIKWYDASTGGTLLQQGVLGSSSIYITPTLTTSTTYYVEASYNDHTSPRKAVVATVNPNLAASVNISASSSSVCSGTSVTFTAIPTNGGTTPTFQWKLNGGNVGANSSTYTNVALANGDSVTCVMSSNATPCLTGSPATSNAVAMTVNPILTASVAIVSFPNGAICVGTTVTFTAAPTNGGTAPTYQWYNGVSVINGATAATYTTTTLANGDGIKVVMTSNATPCLTASPATSNAVVMVVNETPILTKSSPTSSCAGGSVVLSGLPSSGTWTLTRSGTSSATNSGSGASTTISGLAVGTYNFTVANATGCLSAAVSVVIDPLVTNIWDGSVWSKGTPTVNQNIQFAGNYNTSGAPIASDILACSCQIASGIVTIGSGNSMTLTNSLAVSGGSLTFKDKSSLVQINNVTNSGNITYERMTNTTVLNTDFTYWSSPVAPQTLFNLSPKTLSSQFFSYEVTASTEDWKQESSATTMTIGKGYIVRGPESTSTLPPPPGFYKASFYGLPNNGDYTFTGIYVDKSYLFGNPYPSAMDADAFLNENATVLNGTLYFWTHNTALSPVEVLSDPGSGLLAYSSNDYASYNITGGVGTAADITAAAPSVSTGGANISIPSGKIAAGQGFFASSKTLISGTNAVVFNNSMRVDNSGNTLDNSQFFKTSNTKAKTAKAIEKNRVWLNFSNSQGAFKQTLVGYITDATNDYDGRFDGESFDGNEFVDFYSVNQDKNLVIQGRALPFDENDAVPLGYRTTIDGDFTINIDQADGVLRSQAVFIEDKLNKTVFDLKSGDYTFSTAAGTFNERFVLRYTNPAAKTLSTADFTAKDHTVLVSNKSNQIRISAFAETIDKVSVYDMAGKQIFVKTNVNSNELSISTLVSSHQVLVVKTSLQNGNVVSTKVIY